MGGPNSLQPSPFSHDLREPLFGFTAAGERVLECRDGIGQRWDVFLQWRQDIARNVQRPVLGLDLVEADHTDRVLHIGKAAIPAEDLGGVLRLQIVLRAPPAEQA